MKKILVTGGNGFIGTNLILALRQEDNKDSLQVLIIDIKEPKVKLLDNEEWLNLDILKKEEIIEQFKKFKPEIVIHLAAETDCNPQFTLKEYKVNTDGSKNIFDACEESNVSFLVNTSSQYVNQSGKMLSSDEDYAPHTVYGESKVMAEAMLKKGNYTFNWITIRPTNIWGRWHIRYPYEFWKVIRDGKYFHPGHKIVTRSYGYVGNVCDQILQLIKLRNSREVSRQVFYVGDEPLNLYDWVNAFSLAIVNKSVRIVPTTIILSVAIIGTFLQKIQITFPITLSRYYNMTSDNLAPMDKTFKLLGKPKYSMHEGVNITTKWLINYWEENNI
jgi:GlcNAc-P-P-Und epimerase